MSNDQQSNSSRINPVPISHGGWLWDQRMGAEGNLRGWGALTGGVGSTLAASKLWPLAMKAGWPLGLLALAGTAGAGLLGYKGLGFAGERAGRNIDKSVGHNATRREIDRRMTLKPTWGETIATTFGALPGGWGLRGSLGGNSLIWAGMAPSFYHGQHNSVPMLRDILEKSPLPDWDEQRTIKGANMKIATDNNLIGLRSLCSSVSGLQKLSAEGMEKRGYAGLIGTGLGLLGRQGAKLLGATRPVGTTVMGALRSGASKAKPYVGGTLVDLGLLAGAADVGSNYFRSYKGDDGKNVNNTLFGAVGDSFMGRGIVGQGLNHLRTPFRSAEGMEQGYGNAMSGTKELFGSEFNLDRAKFRFDADRLKEKLQKRYIHNTRGGYFGANTDYRNHWRNRMIGAEKSWHDSDNASKRLDLAYFSNPEHQKNVMDFYRQEIADNGGYDGNAQSLSLHKLPRNNTTSSMHVPYTY